MWDAITEIPDTPNFVPNPTFLVSAFSAYLNTWLEHVRKIPVWHMQQTWIFGMAAVSKSNHHFVVLLTCSDWLTLSWPTFCRLHFPLSTPITHHAEHLQIMHICLFKAIPHIHQIALSKTPCASHLSYFVRKNSNEIFLRHVPIYMKLFIDWLDELFCLRLPNIYLRY